MAVYSPNDVDIFEDEDLLDVADPITQWKMDELEAKRQLAQKL